MATIKLEIVVDDTELDNACEFMGAKDRETIDAIKRDFLEGDRVLDFGLIKNPQKRYYHTNGLLGILITVQENISDDTQ